MTVVVPDHLEHYGVPGMKWGKRKVAASKERNASIDGARGRQAVRQAEVRSLTAQRISERSEKGKAHLDRKIADKKFEIENNSDVATSKQLKTGEKVMKGVKITAMLGMSVVGLGVAASIVNNELNDMNNKNFPMSLKEFEVNEKLNSGEKVSFREVADAVASTERQRATGRY